MSFFKSLFGKSKGEAEDDKGIEEHLEYLESLRKPAIMLKKTERDVFSRLGGLPCVSEDFEWPEYKGKPLEFICQIDLSELPEGCERNGLAEKGFLYFFYNREQDTWGFEPEDKGSWRVVYSDGPKEELVKRELPKGIDKYGKFKEKHVEFVNIQTYPNWQDDRIESLNMSENLSEHYIDDMCSSVFDGLAQHHLFGFPAPIQDNDMDLCCEEMTIELDRNLSREEYCDRKNRIKVDRSKWILLFQVDTDDDAGMMWGDCGMLYFWIRRDDLEAGRFDDCWMILQCH